MAVLVSDLPPFDVRSGNPAITFKAMADNAIGPRHFVPLISIALLLAVLLGRAQSTQFQLKKQLTWCEGNSASTVQLSESVDTRLQRASTRRENSHDNGVEESHHGLADCLRKLSLSIRIDNNEEVVILYQNTYLGQSVKMQVLCSIKIGLIDFKALLGQGPLLYKKYWRGEGRGAGVFFWK